MSYVQRVLQPGETVAVSNTFLLKSEAMKGAGED